MALIPTRTEKVCISPSANMEPRNTTIRGRLMARMAAIKKVLSPNSETIMNTRDTSRACENLAMKLAESYRESMSLICENTIQLLFVCLFVCLSGYAHINSCFH